MRSLLLTLLLCFLSLPIHAADLFGDDELEEGEISIADQRDLYNQFFGEFDKKATNSSKKLKLAIQLRENADDEKFQPLRRYILMRINELCQGSKKKEAYDLQVFVFTEQYKKKDSNHKDNTTLIGLLQNKLSKSGKDEKSAIMQEIAAVHNQNGQLSINEKNWDRAKDDFKALSSILSKTGDKDGAKIAKDKIAYIDDYVDEMEDIEKDKAKADANANDVKSNLSVGRFLVKERKWADAVPYLKNGQAITLHQIASCAANEAPSEEEQGKCIVAIGQAIKAKENKKADGLKRSLLEYGLQCKKNLDANQKKISKAMAIKYALVSETFADELDKLGPDPLGSFEIAGSGASVDEARLLRMGWEMVFDHEKPCITRGDFKNSDKVSAEVKNGVLIVKAKERNLIYLDNIPNKKQYAGIKWRMKFVDCVPGGMITLKAGNREKPDVARIIIRAEKGGEAGYSTGYSNEFGAKIIPSNEYVDITILWDGKVATATLNGEAFDKPIPFPHESVAGLQFSTGGGGDGREIHIQSVLGLPR